MKPSAHYGLNIKEHIQMYKTKYFSECFFIENQCKTTEKKSSRFFVKVLHVSPTSLKTFSVRLEQNLLKKSKLVKQILERQTFLKLQTVVKSRKCTSIRLCAFEGATNFPSLIS